MARDAGLDDTGHADEGRQSQGGDLGGRVPGGRDSGGRDSGGRDSGGRDSGRHEAGLNGTDPHGGDAPDARKLAQDWITLWQSELSAIAADPEIREAWQTIMGLWAGSMTAVLRGLPRDPAAHRHDQTQRRPRAADAARPAASAAAPDARDAEIERLARHVAALERRLGELERGGDPAIRPKRGAGRKPRR